MHTVPLGLSTMPTIEEVRSRSIRERPMSLTERALNASGVRAVVHAMQSVQAPQRIAMAGLTSHGGGGAEAPLIEEAPRNSRRFGRRGSTTDTHM